MPRKTDSNNPADWLLICKSDLEVLHMASVQEIGHSLCRSKLAEVVEKVIKAELIRTGWALEKTHDLGKLYEMLKKRSPGFSSVGELCDDLAEAYFSDRYPGFDLEEPDWPKLREQLKQVEALMAAVKSKLPPSEN